MPLSNSILKSQFIAIRSKESNGEQVDQKLQCDLLVVLCGSP